LEAINPDETAVLITAAPMDRRRSFPKWCEKNADFALAGGDGENAGEALAGVVLAEAQSLGAKFAPGAIELLLAKVGANTRLLVEETRKLATYAGEGAAIEEAHVAELTANTAEGDFFEAADAAKFVGATEKSSYNLFSQNAWYVGKLAGSAKLPTLRRLIDNQQDFIVAFEEIVQRPHEQEEVLRELAVRCLAA
ncbi:MAG: DNA polymerase III subunit delta, partial [Verrucomicrobia bacterium]|nr:DNA polymerase III subunit delta [Verrucomicrobiota bacterium]